MKLDCGTIQPRISVFTTTSTRSLASQISPAKTTHVSSSSEKSQISTATTATSSIPKVFQPPAKWSQQTLSSLETLRKQPNLKATVEIKQRPYHVGQNDVIITMRMNDLKLGDVISLDRVREISTGDFILQGNPYIYPSFFNIKAVVIEHPVSAEIVRHHWKKRGHQPVHVNRNHHTALRISEIEVLNPEAKKQ
ncbi:hypothetical protein HDU76_005158 [Blyttiomyces sp. JEL0837]|nr:hypothetical protein HDU76_005158 [Blyttiomyces sp. JEL0837]